MLRSATPRVVRLHDAGCVKRATVERRLEVRRVPSLAGECVSSRHAQPTLLPRLAVDLPDGIAALGPDARQRLDGLVAAAQQHQQQELRDALEETLRIVPKPLRGLVRKVLGA